MPLNDRPTVRPYARIERERRFVVDVFPDFIDPKRFKRLRDVYVDGTHLRYRRVEDPDGRVLQLKLGQKKPDPDAPGDPRRRSMTTLYLEPSEAAPLRVLSGRRSVKRRYEVPDQGWTFALDVWEAPGASAGIMLAEVECPTDEALAAILRPAWASREVTDEPVFSAWRLAR